MPKAKTKKKPAVMPMRAKKLLPKKKPILRGAPFQKPKVRHNPRLKKTFAIVLESKGLKPVSTAMLEAGYPPTTARNPQEITKSKSWAQLMQEYLPDEADAALHLQLLNSHDKEIQQFTFLPEETDEDIRAMFQNTGFRLLRIVNVYEKQVPLTKKEIKEKIELPPPKLLHRTANYLAPDNRTRKDLLDFSYKLKGRYAAEKHDVGFFSLTDLRQAHDERDKMDSDYADRPGATQEAPQEAA